MKRIVIILILIIFPLRVGAISASSYIVMDTDNNRVLEGNNINKESLIASITKILTSMVVINNTNLDKKITISDSVLKSYGSGIYVSVGEEIT
ncbi:MAG: D-alanyl-D-alanine carboxypeptidase, partial [Bacilli bacterium]|nr:D-alanyl-D-alanine carboxypeptidase [Bacilli bacterium]